MKGYPENGGEIIGIPTITDPTKDLYNAEHQSLNDDVFLQDVLDAEEGDMPRPEGFVFETFKRPEVSNMVQKGIDDRFPQTIAWPEKGTIPASEFLPGWFRKAFPKLFPYGKADITCSRLGKNVSI